MAFQDVSKANIAFKNVLGKAHTNNTRDPANEPYSSRAVVLGQYAWGETVHPTDPEHASNSGIVSDLVELTMNPISGTDNIGGTPTSYFLTIEGSVPASLQEVVNPLTNANYQVGDRVGNIIPASVGNAYRPRLYKDSVETPLLDASDWFIDTVAGIVTQEDDVVGDMINYSTGGTVDCYVYIGRSITEAIGQAGGSSGITFYDKVTLGSGITGVIDGSNDEFVLANTPDAGSEHVYLNGVLQEDGGGDYTLNGTTITFTFPPEVNDKLHVSYRVSD